MGIFHWIVAKLRWRKTVRVGIYGAPNAGKTTIANRIAVDWIGREIGRASPVPHETRHIQRVDGIFVNSNGYKLDLSVLDMPGFASQISYKDFTKHGLGIRASKKRAAEAMHGIIEAIRGLEDVDMVLAVMDATKDPYNQVDLTVLGNLEARRIPLIIVANKTDLKRANPDKIREAFPKHEVVSISAKTGENFENLYKSVYKSG